MAFFRRRREEYRVPAPPSPELVEKVREVEITAETQLDAAQARDTEVDARHARAVRMRKENALGPRFWQAVGEHRGT